jgi:hypothetical protein
VSVAPTDGRVLREAFGDPYIRSAAEAKLEPIRVVVEFDQAEFAALNKRAHYDSPAEYLRELALREIAASPRPPAL